MPKNETKQSVEALIEELDITEEELDFWSGYEIKGMGQFYTEWSS